MSHGITDEDRQTLVKILEANRNGDRGSQGNRMLLETAREDVVLRTTVRNGTNNEVRYHRYALTEGGDHVPACRVDAAPGWVTVNRDHAREVYTACKWCYSEGDDE